MVLSKRERLIVIATVVAVGALVLDQIVISPLSKAFSDTLDQKTKLNAELTSAMALRRKQREVAPVWNAWLRSGLKSDAVDAESQVLHSIQDWAQEAGLRLSMVRPDRLTEKTRLPEIAFTASGTGTLGDIGKLVWRVQTATIPIRITEMQLSSRKEGTDDLSFQLRLSTIYVPGRTGPTTATSEKADKSGDE
jgi:hypothetical protein